MRFQGFETTSNENSNTSYIRYVFHHPQLKWPYIKTYNESETGVKEWQVCADTSEADAQGDALFLHNYRNRISSSWHIC